MGPVDFIKGKTPVYGLIGDPVEHSFSPVLQNTIAQSLGVPFVYVPFHVEKGNLSDAVKGAFSLGISGLNVTVPYKTEIIPYLCGVDKKAFSIGAVNTLKRTKEGYVGYNTDILGLSMCFSLRGIKIKDKTVVILGAGGAAKAAAVMAAESGAGNIVIVNRTIEKAEELIDHIAKTYLVRGKAIGYQELHNIQGRKLLIQTTSVGMGEGVSKSPFEDIAFLRDVEAVVDIIYTPWRTKLLQDAEKMGCQTVNGLDMLLYQGMASFEIWHDITIENAKKLQLRNALTQYYREL